MKTPGDKNDKDKAFRYHDLDGDSEEDVQTLYVDGASPGWVPACLLTREVNPKLAQWADAQADDKVPNMSEEMRATTESARWAEMSTDGWHEGARQALEEAIR